MCRDTCPALQGAAVVLPEGQTLTPPKLVAWAEAGMAEASETTRGAKNGFGDWLVRDGLTDPGEMLIGEIASGLPTESMQILR
jgi:hypothetical protein